MDIKQIKHRISVLNVELSTAVLELAHETDNEFLKIHIEKIKTELDMLENELSDLE